MTVRDELDNVERLIWTILRKLEVLALGQYEAHAPALATPEKRAVVEDLRAGTPSDQPLNESDLGEPVNALLASAKGTDETNTLIVQGLLLERLGRTIYNALSASAAAGAATQQLGNKGSAACNGVIESALRLLSQKFGDPERLFQAFVTASRDVLGCLDALSDGVDRVFGERFGLHFADLVGDFTAELLPDCLQLGMNRRKVVCHLTSAMMGQ